MSADNLDIRTALQGLRFDAKSVDPGVKITLADYICLRRYIDQVIGAPAVTIIAEF